MDNRIEFENLRKRYKAFTLGELSFSVPRGYITGLIGRNGAGKTTAIRALLSLIGFEGRLLVDGRPVSGPDYLQRVGAVMDEPFLAGEWAMQAVNAAMAIAYERWDAQAFFARLERFGIAPALRVKELSRGMRIKLMLACALSHGADLLVLDEPTSGLDPMMRDEFVDILKEFVEDERNTVLFSTHITQDLEAVADYIVFIDQGCLVDSCPKDEFMERYRLWRGGPELAGRLSPDILLGVKSTAVGTEALVRQGTPPPPGADILAEAPSIEKIMTLYGRKA